MLLVAKLKLTINKNNKNDNKSMKIENEQSILSQYKLQNYTIESNYFILHKNSNLHFTLTYTFQIQVITYIQIYMMKQVNYTNYTSLQANN